MGKASRFFKSFLGFKTTDSHTDDPDHHKQLKRRWSLGRSRRVSTQLHKASKSIDETAFQHHASALAARMTGGTMGYGVRGEPAAVKIQSCFRGYLARRALRALKALVKLQAVVRGHILRKQTVDMMRRLQALIRAQTRALAVRSQSHINGLTMKPKSHFHHNGPPTPEKIEHVPYTKHDHRSISKRNDSRSYVRGITGQERTFLDGLTDHENEKNVEVDTKKFHVMTKGRKLFQPDQISFWHSQSLSTSRGSTHQLSSSSPCASCELNYFYGSTRGGVPTPVKSDGSSCFSSYSNHPNYMANTESSRAKVRSLSAPRLRPQLEISNATKRDSTYKYVSGMQRVPSKRDSFAKKAYPGSCRLDQLGLPVYDMEESEFCVSYWN